MKVLTSIALITSLSMFLGAQVFATVEKENIELTRINSILNSVYPMIQAAKRQAVPEETLHFHYTLLTKDLQAIQAGIAQKVNAPSVTPRVVKPLNTGFMAQDNNQFNEEPQNVSR